MANEINDTLIDFKEILAKATKKALCRKYKRHNTRVNIVTGKNSISIPRIRSKTRLNMCKTFHESLIPKKITNIQSKYNTSNNARKKAIFKSMGNISHSKETVKKYHQENVTHICSQSKNYGSKIPESTSTYHPFHAFFSKARIDDIVLFEGQHCYLNRSSKFLKSYFDYLCQMHNYADSGILTLGSLTSFLESVKLII